MPIFNPVGPILGLLTDPETIDVGPVEPPPDEPLGPRALAEDEMVNARGPWMAEAGMALVRGLDGLNHSLDAAFRRAYARLGLFPAGPIVRDADLLPLDGAAWSVFLKYLEIETLRVIYGNLAKVDVQATDLQLHYDQLAKRVLAALQELQEKEDEEIVAVAISASVGSAKITAGTPAEVPTRFIPGLAVSAAGRRLIPYNRGW